MNGCALKLDAQRGKGWRVRRAHRKRKLQEAASKASARCARPHPVERIVHGERLIDDYAWLRAANWREVMRDPAGSTPKSGNISKRRTTIRKTAFAKTAKLRKRLIAEMRGRIKEDDSTVPSRDGRLRIFRATVKGGQHPLIAPRSFQAAASKCCSTATRSLRARLISSWGGPIIRRTTGCWPGRSTTPAPSSTKFASGILLPEKISPNHSGYDRSRSWAADSRGFFIRAAEFDHRPSRVFFHRIGTSQEADTLDL